MSAHTQLKKFRGDSSFKTWLYTICVNNCRSRLRKRQTYDRYIGKMQRWFSAESPQPESTTITNEDDARLWASVDKLGPKHRLPIILRYVHDCTAREIGDILGISEGTVYSRIHYAQRQLKVDLREAQQDSTVSGKISK